MSKLRDLAYVKSSQREGPEVVYSDLKSIKSVSDSKDSWPDSEASKNSIRNSKKNFLRMEREKYFGKF